MYVHEIVYVLVTKCVSVLVQQQRRKEYVSLAFYIFQLFETEQNKKLQVSNFTILFNMNKLDQKLIKKSSS